MKTERQDPIIELRGELASLTSRASATIDRVRREQAEVKAAKHAAETALLPLSEVDQRIEQAVAGNGEDFLIKYGAALLAELANPTGEPPRFHLLPLDSFDARCAFEPQVMIAALKRMARAAAYTPGAPLAERAALVAELRERLEKLNSVEEAIVDDLNAAGFNYAHRPEVVARRQEAERERKRQERWDADEPARKARQERSAHEHRLAEMQRTGQLEAPLEPSFVATDAQAAALMGKA